MNFYKHIYDFYQAENYLSKGLFFFERCSFINAKVCAYILNKFVETLNCFVCLDFFLPNREFFTQYAVFEIGALL